MSQPPSYSRQANFTDFAAANPGSPAAGTSLDAEFNALLATVTGLLANIVLIQRDDGKLVNGSVTIDTLAPAVIAMLGASSKWALKGAWVTATAYAQSDVVTQGTGTYACAVAHTAGTFATDKAAGKWTLLFDSAGSTPADGSVTTAKLVDGAVTLAKLAISALDLTGTIRAQGGLAAGTAAVGELLAAKRSSGDAIAKVDRATAAQGIVGYRLGGGTGGIDWYMRQQASSNMLELYDGTAIRVSFSGGVTDFAGRVRATDDATPASGAGFGLRWAASSGYLDSYDHTASAWRDAYMRGAVVFTIAGGVSVAEARSTGVNFPVNVQVAGLDIGYRDIPQNAQDGAYSLALVDRGKHIYSQNSSGQTITIPASATVAFGIGATILFCNRGANPITLSPAGGVTLRQAGTTNTGTRTIAVNGVASIMKTGADEWFISGAGVS
jgi:hypothetical protein